MRGVFSSSSDSTSGSTTTTGSGCGGDTGRGEAGRGDVGRGDDDGDGESLEAGGEGFFLLLGASLRGDFFGADGFTGRLAPVLRRLPKGW